MKKVANNYGNEFDFNVTVQFMADSIREELHAELAPCTEQEFFDVYCKAHENMFCEEWLFAKCNPVF